MFNLENFVKNTIKELKGTIRGKAVIALSGGVDSTTAAVLVSKAIGKNLRCLFVNTGLVRDEDLENIDWLKDNTELNIEIIDASEEFFKALRGVIDPEEKRKIIGELFIRVFERNAEDAKYLIQGTIAPDWIETGSGIRDKIKTHHNVGIPLDVKFQIVEPLRDLYKDEVRKLSQYLGLPESIYGRQPFPGPGLAIRVLGEVTPKKVDIVRRATAILNQEIGRAYPNFEEKPWQYFTVLLPVRSVGVRGDKRAYGYVIAIRMVQSVDGMTAAFFKPDFRLLDKIGTRITNEISEVNRVVYDITNKPPGTIEWE